MLILAVAVAFLLALNFASAADEIDNQTLAGADEITLELEDNSDVLDSGQDDVVSAEVDNNNDVKDEIETIKMGKVVKRYNGAIQYQATFYDAAGNPLKNAKVYFEVDDSMDYESTTDSNGVALLTVLINNGNHKIAAICKDPIGVAYDNIKVFDVITGAKNIEMYYDGGNTYKVRVFDDNGNPVKAGEKVTFAIGKKTYVKKTDKDGFAKLKIASTPGLYEMGVKYNNYLVVTHLYVKQVLKPITSFKNKKVKPKIRFKVKFLGKNKKGKIIKVKFNKKTYKAKTNKKGIATFSLKTPKKVGKYNLVTLYKKTKVSLTYTKYYG